MIDPFLNIKYDEKGLIPVIVQDYETAEVLMMAYASEESLKLTLEKDELVFYSRSRQELWHKGATSGNRMTLMSLQIDCDGDTLLAQVTPMGPACHTGNRTCFYTNLMGDDSKSPIFAGKLWKYLTERAKASPEESYTAKLVKGSRARVAQKVGEEGVEVALAIATEDRPQIVYEAADLIYHLMTGLIASDVSIGEIWQELKKRHRE